MKKLFPIYLIFVFTFFSCARGIVVVPANNVQQVYQEFWTYVDEHYIYFKQKEVDWDEVFNNYYPALRNGTEQDLYQAIEASVLLLKDTHNRFEADGKLAQGFDFREGWEIHFSSQLVEEKYLIDTFEIDGYLHYGYMEDNIGYIYLPAFNYYKNLGSILKEMHERPVTKIIFDMRSNGGGDSNDIPDYLGHFVKEETILGGYVEKSGPGHDDVIDPILIRSYPSDEFVFDIPVVVLINRGSYSATSYFAAMTKGLPNFKLVGQITGGGGGGNYGYQLSNGWIIAISVSDFIDKEGNSIETGVVPDIEITNSKDDINNQIDRMLEFALEMN